ncbi:Rossmann-fold NAD(P)-binding domain-containing protein [Streptomyces aureocirculatus]|uniref:NAD(P)H-binding protein n=1 Tax=Streptomyces aureocirculatus TaxID=67275 RepID=UPI0012FF2FEF|nr:NAD(P)H-binding protein [Streptomyces aureocirculatus]
MAEASTLVLGATGAHGRHVLDALVARVTRPETITAAGRNQSRLGELASAGFSTAAVDLSDSVGVTELVAGHSDIVSSVVLEREVTYQPVTPQELQAALINTGMDGGLASFLVSLDETIAAGAFARVGDDLSRLLGRPTTGLVEGLTAGAQGLTAG